MLKSDLYEPSKYFDDEILLFYNIRILTKGYYFGELGIHFNRPRGASILCAEDSHFISIDKPTYLNILQKNLEAKILKSDFFRKYFFEDIHIDDIWELIYHFSLKKFTKKYPIFSAGDPIKYVYVVKEGLIDVNQNPFLQHQLFNTHRSIRK